MAPLSFFPPVCGCLCLLGSSYMFWKSIRATNFIFNLAAALFVVAEARRATAARQLIKNVCSSGKKELE